MNHILPLIAFLLFSLLHAEDALRPTDVKDLASALKVSDAITHGIGNGDGAKALETAIKLYWYKRIDLDLEIEQLVGPFKNVDTFKDFYGEPIKDKNNVEYLGSDALANVSYRLFYVVKMERGYVPVLIIWYAGETKWRLFAVYWGNAAELAFDKFRVATPK